MSTIQEALNLALQHHRSGNFAEAESVYRRILDVAPTEPQVLHLLGALCLQQHRSEEAIVYISRTLELQPDNPDSLNNLGGALLATGRINDAETSFRRAVTLVPHNPKFHFDLGSCRKQQGHLNDAIVSFQQALSLKPDFIQAMNNLGTTLTACGRDAEAVETFQAALKIKPDYANAHNGLGNALLNLGRVTEAMQWLAKSVELRPNEPRFHCNLGVAQKAVGEFNAALHSYQQALRLQPDFLEARKNLGNLFISQQQPAAAVKEFEAAATVAPNDYQLHLSAGDCYRDMEEFEKAKACYQRAAALKPDNVWLKRRAAFLCPSIFDSALQIDEFRTGLWQQIEYWNTSELAFDRNVFESAALMPPFGLTYHGRNDRPLKQALGEHYRSSFPAKPDSHTARPVADRPRIGFLVTNGHEGIFLRCMAGILDRLDRSSFSIHVAAPAAAAATLRNGLQNTDTHFLELPDRFVSMVPVLRDADLDVLYFWECGTDLFNYFLPFERLAPVQCTGWGLPVTSGIPAMDFYLSSELTEPADAADHYSETLIKAQTLLTWQEQISLPSEPGSRADFGFSATDHLYLCAQNLMKFHPDFDEILSGILLRDPAAIIVLAEGQQPHQTTALQSRFRQLLPGDSARIRFLPRMEFDDYLSLVQLADVALDPLHYGSGITTYEILSCGTPLITLPTAFRRGRFVKACYDKMDYEECVATSVQDYIDIACRLATSPQQRTVVSNTIAQRRHVLFRDQQAVDAFELALRLMLDS